MEIAHSFHLVALGERNKVLVRKKFSRAQLLAYTANLPSSRAGLEACAGPHFMGERLQKQGHEVRLIPAQFVKPYRKSNKNDFNDARGHRRRGGQREHALCADQKGGAADVQAMHRVRDRLVHWHGANLLQHP